MFAVQASKGEKKKKKKLFPNSMYSLGAQGHNLHVSVPTDE